MLIKFCKVINSKAVSKVYFAELSDYNLFRGKITFKNLWCLFGINRRDTPFSDVNKYFAVRLNEVYYFMLFDGNAARLCI